jgi:hypothetical protein
LNQLRDALTILEKPDAVEYFGLGDRIIANGKTVIALARYMNEHRLKFAPAAGGDEEAYQKLHQAFVTYLKGARQP